MLMKQITKNHLLGCVDTLLFMPQAGQRFSNSYNYMLGSFVIPVLFFPLMLLTVLLYPQPEMAEQSQNTISLIYTLRFTIALGIFLGFVYFLSRKTDRTDHFFRFVTANNWLTVPSVILSLPVAIMMSSADPVVAQQGYVLSYILLIYTFAFTAFIAACTLRIPIELAGFVAIIGFQINNSSYEIIDWIGTVLSS